VINLPRVFTPWCPAETRICDLLIASPTLYRNTTTPPHVTVQSGNSVEIKHSNVEMCKVPVLTRTVKAEQLDKWSYGILFCVIIYTGF